MNRRKHLAVPFLLLACALSGCAFANPGISFPASRTGNDGQFQMEFSALNACDAAVLTLAEGDAPTIPIVRESGRLDILA